MRFLRCCAMKRGIADDGSVDASRGRWIPPGSWFMMDLRDLHWILCSDPAIDPAAIASRAGSGGSGEPGQSNDLEAVTVKRRPSPSSVTMETRNVES